MNPDDTLSGAFRTLSSSAKTPTDLGLFYERIGRLLERVSTLHDLVSAASQATAESAVGTAGILRVATDIEAQLDHDVKEIHARLEEMKRMVDDLADEVPERAEFRKMVEEDLVGSVADLSALAQSYKGALSAESPIPSQRALFEIRRLVRKLNHKHMETGEDLDGFNFLSSKLAPAFWAAFGTLVASAFFHWLAPRIRKPEPAPVPNLERLDHRVPVIQD